MLGAVIIGLATESALPTSRLITSTYRLRGAARHAWGAAHRLLGRRRMNSYYLINLLIYAAVDAMACLA